MKKKKLIKRLKKAEEYISTLLTNFSDLEDSMLDTNLEMGTTFQNEIKNLSDRISKLEEDVHNAKFTSESALEFLDIHKNESKEKEILENLLKLKTDVKYLMEEKISILKILQNKGLLDENETNKN